MVEKNGGRIGKLTEKDAFALIQRAFDGLEDGGVIEGHIEVTGDTVLIGPGTVLDSIGFVTLFTDLEELLSDITGEEIFLLIDEIHEFNPEDTFLTAAVLAKYLENMLENMGK
jgi:acyl carrier protein